MSQSTRELHDNVVLLRLTDQELNLIHENLNRYNLVAEKKVSRAAYIRKLITHSLVNGRAETIELIKTPETV